jgi:phosphotransferase system HPr-like phosphotransfer protein
MDGLDRFVSAGGASVGEPCDPEPPGSMAAALKRVQTASKFDAEVLTEGRQTERPQHQGRDDVAATQGSTIELTAKGPQAAEALELRVLIAANRAGLTGLP